MDQDDVVKLIKWFLRAIYPGKEKEVAFIRALRGELLDAAWRMDENEDGVLDMKEANMAVQCVAVKYNMDLSTDSNGYLEDYDFNSDGLWNKIEFTALIKRCTRAYL